MDFQWLPPFRNCYWSGARGQLYVINDQIKWGIAGFFSRPIASVLGVLVIIVWVIPLLRFLVITLRPKTQTPSP